MAVKTLTVANAKAFDSFVSVDFETATAAADGFEATVDGDILVLAYNSSADTAYDITMKYGNAMQGMADQTVELAFGQYYLYKVTTGKMKNMTGANKGKILIVPENVAVKVKVVEI